MNTDTSIPCPRCGEDCDRLKTAILFDRLIFLVLGASIRTERLLACPRCMRKRIANRTLANVWSAHVIWPLTVLPMHAWFYLSSFLPGHHAAVRRGQ